MMRALIIGILSAGALGACSTTPSHPAGRTTALIPLGWCSTADGKAVRPGAKNCDLLTRSYSGVQLQQTGRTDVAHALQMLDPSITVRGP